MEPLGQQHLDAYFPPLLREGTMTQLSRFVAKLVVPRAPAQWQHTLLNATPPLLFNELHTQGAQLLSLTAAPTAPDLARKAPHARSQQAPQATPEIPIPLPVPFRTCTWVAPGVSTVPMHSLFLLMTQEVPQLIQV